MCRSAAHGDGSGGGVLRGMNTVVASARSRSAEQALQAISRPLLIATRAARRLGRSTGRPSVPVSPDPRWW